MLVLQWDLVIGQRGGDRVVARECQTGSTFSCELHMRHCSSGASLQQERREKTQCGPGFEYLTECGKVKSGLLASSWG